MDTPPPLSSLSRLLILRWFFHVNSKKLPKFKKFLDFFATQQICGIYRFEK